MYDLLMAERTRGVPPRRLFTADEVDDVGESAVKKQLGGLIVGNNCRAGD